MLPSRKSLRKMDIVKRKAFFKITIDWKMFYLQYRKKQHILIIALTDFQRPT